MSNNNERKAFEEFINVAADQEEPDMSTWTYDDTEVEAMFRVFCAGAEWQARAVLVQKQEYLTELNFEYAEISALGIKAVLYTDVINNRQVCRDDLWLATTTSLEKLRAAPPSPPPLTDEQLICIAVGIRELTWNDVPMPDLCNSIRAIIAQSRGEK